jgi:hypothetical protein
LKRTTLTSVAELPRARFKRRFHHRDTARLRLSGGREVLLWAGHGYEDVGGRFERTWELGYGMSYQYWTGVAWGDGFFYESDFKVFSARSGRRPRRALPDADDVLHVFGGPADTVLVCQAGRKRGLAARLWFPAEGTYVPLYRRDLGARPRQRMGPFYYSEKTRHFYFFDRELCTMPEEEWLGRKRVRPRNPGPLFEK